ncbi:MAG: hypothetical protein WEE36_07710 [Acidimicrobiia bacterium]
MGLLDRFTNKDLLKGGLPATAVLRYVPKYAGSVDEQGSRSDSYRLDLEVRIEGRDPYAIVQKVRVPKRYWDITTGVSLPVKVDAENPQRMLVDWDAFDAAGGENIVEELGDQYRRDQVKEFQSKNPEARRYAEAARQADLEVVEALIGMFQAGQRSADEVIEVIDDYVADGSLTDEQGAAAKARVKGAN